MFDLFERLPLRLIPLSPIHVGTGEVLNWTEAVVDAEHRQILRFRPEDLAAGLPASERAKLDKLGEYALRDDFEVARFIGQAQQFLKSNIRQLRRISYSRSAITADLARDLDSRTGVSRSATANCGTVQALEISEAMLDPRSGRPMLAGSGIKGALKTAWLDYISPRQLPGFHEDPFSQIMLEDFISGPAASTAILIANNVKRRPRAVGSAAPPSLPVKVVAIVPGPHAVFSGALRVRIRQSTTGPTVIRPAELLKHCHDFHSALWRFHLPYMAHHAPSWWLQAIDSLLNEGPRSDLALVRVGKFCTAEAKRIRVRVSRSEHRDLGAGTTFWMAGDSEPRNRLPFGWALLLWGATPAPSIIERIATEHPWQTLLSRAVTTPAGDEQAVAEQPTDDAALHPELRNMQALFSQGSLHENYLKNELKRAQNYDSEKRSAVRDWVQQHYKQVVPQKFKHKPIEDLLARLK
ncbi:MAG: hypothetical protein E6R12_09865 [Sphingomonadales bacterium]|nr:MAG: hypothetical protein E6R12_09865 [Sphingomonadales bacterium]